MLVTYKSFGFEKQVFVPCAQSCSSNVVLRSGIFLFIEHSHFYEWINSLSLRAFELSCILNEYMDQIVTSLHLPNLTKSNNFQSYCTTYGSSLTGAGSAGFASVIRIN